MEKLAQLREKSQLFEKELLNRIFFSDKEIPKCLTLIDKNDFTKYGQHYEIITDSYRNGKNVLIAFKSTGLSSNEFMNTDLIFRPIESICEDLKNVSNSITLWAILQKGVEDIPTENVKSYISEIQQNIIKKIKNGVSVRNDIQSIVQKFEDKKTEYQEKKARGDELLGISTGYKGLDELIDGLRPAHFWVIGGYTNYGKTSFTLNIVANLVKQNKRVVFYSLEMDDTDIFAKLLGILSGENGVSIMKGYGKDTSGINENIKKIINSNISIHTGMFELSEILYSMHEESVSNPTTVFVIDFIQNMTVKNSKSEYETVTACALELQQCAKRLQIPIIALSQISNEGARNVSSVMSFKGSGAIASAADLAIEIGIDASKKEEWTEKKQKGEPVMMEIDVRKNRHGRTKLIDMIFDMTTGRFTDAQEDAQENINKIF